MGRAPRGTLNRDAILDAALALADAGGLDAISMRAIGSRLGVHAMSLYNHVESKAALLDGLHERLICSIEFDPSDDMSWRDALRDAARAYRKVALAHPRVFVLLATRPLATPAELAHVAPFLQVLVRHGLIAREQLFVLNVFFTSLNGVLVAEVSPVPGHEDAAEPDSAGLFSRAFADDASLASIGSGIAGMITETFTGDEWPAAWFDAAVEVLLRGLEPVIEK